MKCRKCGVEMDNNALICPSCGQVVSDEDRLQGQYGGTKLTKAEFLNLPAMKSCKSNIISCAVVLYVLGVINIGLYLYWKSIPIDGLVLILLGLGIQLAKSRVVAIVATIYGAINTIYVTISTGRIGGWWILLVAIYALIYTFKYQSAWAQYQKDGSLPVEK